ncbi:MAG TPA: hypothetical protein VFQ44_31025 [Streptosporangiaceae bacterium]|nr:hypothetical protein [Streptosporangiaceae bacterium]
MTTEGDDESQRAAVADVATSLFGLNVAPHMVIGETVERTTSLEAATPATLPQRATDGSRRLLTRNSPHGLPVRGDQSARFVPGRGPLRPGLEPAHHEVGDRAGGQRVRNR